MAADYFLKIDGVEGESTSDKHKGEIDIESFSWGVANSASAAHGGGGAGKVAMQDFHFVMKFNKASPKIFQAAASGEHFQKAVLTVSRAGKEIADFLTWTMSDCLVSSYETGANSVAVTESVGGTEEPSPEVSAARNAAEGSPVDEFSLVFAKIEVSYKVQNPDGGLGAPVTAGWDLASNKKV
jgi:type VI secretion system secreted protein Hcp